MYVDAALRLEADRRYKYVIDTVSSITVLSSGDALKEHLAEIQEQYQGVQK